ncbi:MAG TPA: hypothetical protein PLA18_03615 [Deltaproteobacteria bacterium]|jgi:hypothetical protein|nr:hypothetical protein [Deltaproteobacteria bacterium]
MNEIKKVKYQKFFLISAIYNFMAAFNGMMFFKMMSKMLFKTVPAYGVTTFILRTFYTHVLVFGFGYYLVSRNPEKNRGIVWMGMLAKIPFFFAAIPYYLKKKITLLTLILAFGDFVFGVLFGLFLLDTRKDVKAGDPQ